MGAYKRHIETENISELTIARLSIYLRCVDQLLEAGVDTVSSQELAKRFNLVTQTSHGTIHDIAGYGYEIRLQRIHLLDDSPDPFVSECQTNVQIGQLDNSETIQRPGQFLKGNPDAFYLHVLECLECGHPGNPNGRDRSGSREQAGEKKPSVWVQRSTLSKPLQAGHYYPDEIKHEQNRKREHYHAHPHAG